MAMNDCGSNVYFYVYLIFAGVYIAVNIIYMVMKKKYYRIWSIIGFMFLVTGLFPFNCDFYIDLYDDIRLFRMLCVFLFALTTFTYYSLKEKDVQMNHSMLRAGDD